MVRKFVVGLFQSILKHNIGALAAVIAFFGWSSLVPVLALLVFLASHIAPADAVHRFLQGILHAYIPDLPTAMGQGFAKKTITRLTSYGGRVSILGFVGLIWGTVGGFVNLQQILDTIRETRQRRSFLLQYVIAFVMMGVLLGLTIAASVASAVSPSVVAALMHAHEMAAIQMVHLVSTISFPVILLVTVYAAYRVLPSRKMRNAPVWIGAVLATVFIYLSRLGFVIYTHHLGNYQLMYGTFTFVTLLTFWIYIVCIILLVCFEVAAVLEKLWHGEVRMRLPSARMRVPIRRKRSSP